ncbi:MAG: hypothetical protein HC914_14160 [Chloroflexaceae bacterium]|nr:hypothetical protein [Chloroflexaceae bacterium]
MNRVALRRLIGGSVLVWVVCTVVLMTHPVMPQQQVDAQAVPTAAATQASAVEQTAFRVFMPLVLKRQGIVSDLINVPSSPANAMYATEQWDLLTEIEINGQIEQRTIAFAEGYFADVATPSVFAGQNVSYIIIGFGRQIEPQVGDDRLWGVDFLQIMEAMSLCHGSQHVPKSLSMGTPLILNIQRRPSLRSVQVTSMWIGDVTTMETSMTQISFHCFGKKQAESGVILLLT